MRPALIALTCLATLTACGATTNRPVTVVDRPLPPADTFNTREADRRALLNDFADLTETQPFDVPFTSRLRYQGLLNTTLGPSRNVIGEVDLNVDTVRETISGTAGNFRNQFNRDLQGELEIFRGTFDENPDFGDNQAVAGLRGTLREGSLRDYAISGQIQGDVLGRDARAFEGTVTGAVKINGGPQEVIKGGIVAERQ